jgi:hypothetical protein
VIELSYGITKENFIMEGGRQINPAKVKKMVGVMIILQENMYIMEFLSKIKEMDTESLNF